MILEQDSYTKFESSVVFVPFELTCQEILTGKLDVYRPKERLERDYRKNCLNFSRVHTGCNFCPMITDQPLPHL